MGYFLKTSPWRLINVRFALRPSVFEISRGMNVDLTNFTPYSPVAMTWNPEIVGTVRFFGGFLMVRVYI